VRGVCYVIEERRGVDTPVEQAYARFTYTLHGKKWGQTELTRVSRTLQNGIILPEEVSNGKASDLQ
jgi:hypothetical protein